jgi:putative selenium metabolism hydrolase
MAQMVVNTMKRLKFDEVTIDSTGNVIGRIGSSPTIIQFDSHMDTVEVNDTSQWEEGPFSGKIVHGEIWGRGSVDMKSGLMASIYAAARAREMGYLTGKTVYITATVCEEYCDGENLQMLYQETQIKPHYCIICEPSGNVITTGHKGKAQIKITTHGVSAHGSAPEKGVNAVYAMADIIQRVEALNRKLAEKKGSHGTIVLSDISCISASLNAVPSSCSIYLDRRLSLGESLQQVHQEMDALIEGKDAVWEIGTLIHTSWKGAKLTYQPMHEPWEIALKHPLTKALERAYTTTYGKAPSSYDFWDFGTNAITPVAMGIPVIGFGPGEYKRAHMRDERCAVQQIIDACTVYTQLIHTL